MQRPLFALSLISLTLALAACGGGSDGTVGTPGVAPPAAAPTGTTTTTTTQTLSISTSPGVVTTLSMAAASSAVGTLTPDLIKGINAYVGRLAGASTVELTPTITVAFAKDDPKLYVISVEKVGGGLFVCVSSAWTADQLTELSKINGTSNFTITPSTCNTAVTIDSSLYTATASKLTLTESLPIQTEADGTVITPTPSTLSVDFSLQLPKP